MSISLAAAWRPRGELARFKRLYSELRLAYSRIVISLPPQVEGDLIEQLSEFSQVEIVVTEEWLSGRYAALERALAYSTEYIQYADFDRLVRWVETRPDEWLRTLEVIQTADCLIIGRSDQAYRTHPEALIQTEKISNSVVSNLLDQVVDVSAGSKGFSKAAAGYIVANCEPLHPLGADAEWPLILKKAGFQVAYIAVDGLDWESADRFLGQAADSTRQRQAAQEYDSDPTNWEHRVGVALEIVKSGFDAANREIEPGRVEYDRQARMSVGTKSSDATEFNYESVFEVEDYLHFYADGLTDERTQGEVAFLVRELSLDRPQKILDLACGFGRHSNALAGLGHSVTGLDLVPGFIEIARREAEGKNLPVQYVQGDMRQINYQAEFDRILLMFTSFGYFEDQQNLTVLKNISWALKPGGMLVLDTHNRDVFLKEMQPYLLTEKGPDFMIDRGSFDTLTGRWYNHRVVIRDGIRKDKPFFVRLYNPNEISNLIQQVGLQVDKIFGGFDSQPLTNDSQRMVIIAQKPLSG